MTEVLTLKRLKSILIIDWIPQNQSMRVDMGGVLAEKNPLTLLSKEHQGPFGAGKRQGWPRRATLTS